MNFGNVKIFIPGFIRSVFFSNLYFSYLSAVMAAVLFSSPCSADLAAAQKAYLAKDFAAAVKELKPLLEKGDAKARMSFAFMLAKGEGVPQNFSEAFVLATLAQEASPDEPQKQKAVKFLETLQKKMTPGQISLASKEVAKRRNTPTFPPSPIASSPKTEKPPEPEILPETSDNPSPPYEPTPEDKELLNQAIDLEETDPLKAKGIMRGLAEKGYERAIVNLGIGLTGHVFGNPDYEEGVKWLEKGVSLGHEDCLYALTLLNTGDAFPKDDPRLFKWLLQYAEVGNPSSQFSVGCKYFSGEGVSQDLNESYFWTRLAFKNGVSDARESLSRDYGEVSQADREVVEQRIAEWKAKPMQVPMTKN